MGSILLLASSVLLCNSWADCGQTFSEKDIHLKAGRVAAKDLTLASKSGKVKLEAGEEKDFYHHYHKSSGLITTSVDDEGHDRTTQKPVEIAAQTVSLPSPAAIDYKVGLGKEFREALAGRKDINWNAVADNYREWSEHTTTLSGPARMLVACVLTAATNGLGSKWFAAHGITEGTATNAALSAGIQAVTVSAGTSFAGNLGDISQTFDELTSADFVKSLASTMLTAGISQSLSTSLQLPDKPETFPDSLKTNATHGLVRTGVDSAIYGGKVGKNLAQTLTTAAVDAGSAQIAHTIGDGKHSGALNQLTHKAAHGVLAVTGAKLTDRDPVSAAIGAVVSETAAEAMDRPDASPEERRQIADKARLIGDTVAFVAGRDVASADSAGRTAVENNYGGHPDEETVPPIDVLLETADKPLTERLLTYTQASIEEGVKETQLWNETSTVMAPYAATGVVMGVGMGVPLVAKTLTVLCTAATAHYFGSIAVDSGVAGLKQEAKDHPILTTMAVMPFVPVPKVLNVVKNTTKAEQATQAVQQKFKFVQELQPAKKVESVVNAAPAATTTAKAVTTETKAVQTGLGFMQERIPSTNGSKTVVDTEKRWSKTTEFKGTTIHQRDSFIDPLRIDPKTGKTNYELMKDGNAPIGPDGKAIELHHVLQRPDEPLVEITNQLHTKYKKQLHINPDSWGSAIDRTKHAQFRKEYWKERAKDFEEVMKNAK